MWRFLRCNSLVKQECLSMKNWTVAALVFFATSEGYGSLIYEPNLNAVALGSESKKRREYWNTRRLFHTSSNIASCEPSSSKTEAKIEINSKAGKGKDEESHIADGVEENPEVTFRQRRLSINNTRFFRRHKKRAMDENETASIKEKGKNKKEEIQNSIKLEEWKKSSVHIKFSAEFEENEETNENSEKEGTTYKPQSTAEPPFSLQHVGTYSCHGIEPHPQIVFETPEADTEVTALFKKMFGGDLSSTTSRAKVITISKKKINQDRAHICAYKLPKKKLQSGEESEITYNDNLPSALFGVYDGHGEKGELLASYTMNALFEKLHVHPNFHGLHDSIEQDIGKAFHEVCTEIDKEVKENVLLAPYSSGSTACVVLLQGNKLWNANIGDSRAVIGRRHAMGSDESKSNSIKAFNLSKDQNVHIESERNRIINSGGYITLPKDPNLPARIWLDVNCSQVGLAMSRSIGDHALKHVGVIAEPVVETYDIDNQDEFIIIASDGVWEFVSSQEAVEIISECFDQGMNASEACKELIRIAMRKWKEHEGAYRDDITAIVVQLDGLLKEIKE